MHHHASPRRRTILLFTWAAGCVDAIVYIKAHVFTANMTGNAVLLGISAGRDLSRATVHSLVALVAFAAGVVLSSILVGEEGHGIPWKGVRIAAVTETIVLVLFAGVFLLPIPQTSELALECLIVLSGFAMGMQSATVKRLNLPGIATTYITGTMTSLIAGMVHHWGSDDGEGSDENKEDSTGLDPSVALQAWVFVLYALAAMTSALTHKYWPSAVALLPLAAITAMTATVYVQHPPRKLH
jgi:uncharacterized membrane protein YoaK (UPF0700 family)